MMEMFASCVCRRKKTGHKRLLTAGCVSGRWVATTLQGMINHMKQEYGGAEIDRFLVVLFHSSTTTLSQLAVLRKALVKKHRVADKKIKNIDEWANHSREIIEAASTRIKKTRKALAGDCLLFCPPCTQLEASDWLWLVSHRSDFAESSKFTSPTLSLNISRWCFDIHLAFCTAHLTFFRLFLCSWEVRTNTLPPCQLCAISPFVKMRFIKFSFFHVASQYKQRKSLAVHAWILQLTGESSADSGSSQSGYELVKYKKKVISIMLWGLLVWTWWRT